MFYLTLGSYSTGIWGSVMHVSFPEGTEHANPRGAGWAYPNIPLCQGPWETTSHLSCLHGNVSIAEQVA